MCLQSCAYLSSKFKCPQSLPYCTLCEFEVQVSSKLTLLHFIMSLPISTSYNYKLLESRGYIPITHLCIPHRTSQNPGTEQAKCLPLNMGCTLEFHWDQEGNLNEQSQVGVRPEGTEKLCDRMGTSTFTGHRG